MNCNFEVDLFAINGMLAFILSLGAFFEKGIKMVCISLRFDKVKLRLNT
jgi:hypothetical protein